MSDEWTPQRIRELRDDLQMSQAVFGQEIWDADSPTAQKNVSRLENGHVDPSAAVRRTLERLEEALEEQKPLFRTIRGFEIEGVGEDGDQKD